MINYLARKFVQSCLNLEIFGFEAGKGKEYSPFGCSITLPETSPKRANNMIDFIVNRKFPSDTFQ